LEILTPREVQVWYVSPEKKGPKNDGGQGSTPSREKKKKRRKPQNLHQGQRLVAAKINEGFTSHCDEEKKGGKKGTVSSAGPPVGFSLWRRYPWRGKEKTVPIEESPTKGEKPGVMSPTPGK